MTIEGNGKGVYCDSWEEGSKERDQKMARQEQGWCWGTERKSAWLEQSNLGGDLELGEVYRLKMEGLEGHS